jgi:divalent metal cation (Fe/Co/Zn/Cd) transporter
MATATHRQALLLSFLTVGYNLLEGVASLVFAGLAGSAALLGFGIDSFVECLSGLIMVWRFSRPGDDRERTAVRLVGWALLILAVYVGYESTVRLYLRDAPEPTAVGIVIALISLVAMPVLFFAKRSVGKGIGSQSLLADAQQTLGCILLSLALLFGLGFNYLFGLWQADPIAGLVIAGFLVREGYRVLTAGEVCQC